jgi:hypothetical protein
LTSAAAAAAEARGDQVDQSGATKVGQRAHGLVRQNFCQEVASRQAADGAAE